ncbi:MAG: insulinase family protein, partial [Oscillospiraceae bacterium]
MTTKLVRTAIAEGVSLSVLSDAKFKHNRLSVNLIVPLDSRTVTGYALQPLLLRKGCKSCPDFTELNRRLDALYGAALMTEVSKCGASQVITVGINSVDDRFTLDSEQLVRDCAQLVRDLLVAPRIENGAFPAADVALEKQNLIDTIEAEINDKRSYALSRCRTVLGGEDPAALRKYGTVEQARAITPESAAKSYQSLLDSATVEILFVGPGDVSAAAEIMKKTFAGLPRHAGPFAVPHVVARAESVREEVERLDVAQAKLVLGFRTGEKGDARSQAAMRLMTALYGGTPSSKLFTNVREKLSLCYYCSARYDRAGALLFVESGVEQKNLERARTEILRQLEEIQNDCFEDETLENTRLMIKNSLRAVSDSTGALEEWYLNRIILGSLASPEEELALLDG